MRHFSGFYNDKRVFLTGHTGFKGAWMCLMLSELGAIVKGYSLNPKTDNDLFIQAKISELVIDVRGDVLDKEFLEKHLTEFQPEIVFHFAAQPLVLESYKNPYYTWNVNLNGTINLLEAIRRTPSIKSVVIITTDKVYMNQEKNTGYVESDPLGGHDPYSASKAAIELAVSSWRDSFFQDMNIGIATARAGNVIGGGDWSENRLIPDFFRAYNSGKSLILRNPDSIRPWQHVLDVLSGYLNLAHKLYDDSNSFSGAWNFGPSENNYSTLELINEFNKKTKIDIICKKNLNLFIETKILCLDSSKSQRMLSWKNYLNFNKMIELTLQIYLNIFNDNLTSIISNQINDFLKIIELSESNL